MITDKTYPIETKWIKKSAIITAPFFTFFLAFLLGGIFSMITDILNSASSQVSYNFKIFIVFFVVGIIIFPPITYGYLILRRINFNYEFREEFIMFKQGILTKSERTVPYGRIQHIVLSQGPIDRLMRLASLTIETASEGGGANLAQAYPLFGFASNTIRIPGLSYANALKFKESLMEFMKKNPIDDAQSGL
jgi:membrane protein YdbS with pleckstrin-like domain